MTRAMAILLVAAALACAPKEKPAEKLYDLKGKVVSRDARDNTLRIDHEAIPGFMEAMTMDYSVRGAKVDSMPADGKRIAAKLHVTETGYWITDVRPR